MRYRLGGFTLAETIIIVAVVGILAMTATVVFREPDRLALARDQIILHIRYTQHLGVMDDKFDPSDANWRFRRWRLRFENTGFPEYAGGKANGWSYSIFADKDKGANNAPSLGELAKDPLTKRLLSGGFNDSLKSADPRATPEMALWYWRVETLVFTNCNRSIAFDEIGRPYNAGAKTIKALTRTCKITLKGENEESASVCIEPETGYAHEC
ncbi:MAG: hypothetical protein LBF86_08225 [Helicobacteraceae bacterium]|jgi:hypothetical protein|nr:hypothetical protein [Helicobacteraceae bacterium]